jgi:DNA-directed RNA polymerase I subunit RPA2
MRRSLVEKMRFLKVAGHPDVPGELEITFVPDWSVRTYPGVYIATTPARMLRPVRNLRLREKAATDAVNELIAKVRVPA